MQRRVELIRQYRRSDGRYVPGLSFGSFDTDRVVYLERTDEWQGQAVTAVHLDDGTILDVAMNLNDVIALVNGEAEIVHEEQ